MRNADTFVASTYWIAWPNLADSDDFKTKTEAASFCRRNGGGAIRKVRRNGSTSADTIEVEAA